MTMLKGRAVGGPRNGVTIEAGKHWNGFVHKTLPSTTRTPYRGRYVWADDYWEWKPGVWKKKSGRTYNHDEAWVWVDEVSGEQTTAFAMKTRVDFADKTRTVTDRTANTIVVTKVVKAVPDCSAGCGKPAKAWWRRTCGDPACRAQSCRLSMLARRNKPTSKAR